MKPNLVDPKKHGIRAGIIWWATDEAREDYGVTAKDLEAAGVRSLNILIDQSLVEPLRQINQDLASHQLEVEIDDGYRSKELYELASRKVAERKGDSVSKSLFNLTEMPHTTGKAVDIALVSTEGTRVPLFDKEDGTEASFLGYYEQFDDEKSRKFVYLQKLLGRIMISNGFEYGSKGEVWHFNYVG